MKITKTISLLLVAVISSFFFTNKVNAYFTSDDSATNTFTIAKPSDIMFVYSYIDENNNKQTLAPSEVRSYFDGTALTLSDFVDSSVDYDHVTYYVNNVQYANNTTTINGNTVIEIEYYLNRYSITYDLDGGTLNNPVSSYTSMTSTFDLPTPTKTNYTFDGWCVGNNCSNPYTVTQGSTGNISVTASWVAPRTFTVSYTGETGNYSYSGALTALEGSTYESVITATGGTWESQIDTVTVTMGGNTVQGAYNNDNRTVTVENVSGNIVINVTTNCLIEGTKIMLWDGSTKNVEDITYNDLLKVWNHDTGTFGYEYPAWIERAGTVSKYTKVTFDDGTELKVASDHRLFSRRLNKYVNINSGELAIGDEVVSLKNNGVGYVSIVNIETIYEEANYYHVITTRYFNMIAEGLLTTYEIYDEISSNYKGFDSNMKWVNYTPEDKKLSYEDVLNIYGYVDKYLYKAMKIEDFGYAVEQGFISQETLAHIVAKYMRSDNFKVVPPKDEFGNYLWMVTTSDDINPSDTTHQLVEGTLYLVPTPNNEENFLYWYNHSDNKTYSPGDEIEVDSSMYLEAIYE